MPEIRKKEVKQKPVEAPPASSEIDLMPVVEAMEKQTLALLDVLEDAMKDRKQEKHVEKPCRWVFTVVRNQRTGDLEKVIAEKV